MTSANASESREFDGPVAEFAALRQEIDQRSAMQQTVLTLQLTLSGAVFSFAITSASQHFLLLVIPVTTYLLCCRYATLHYGIQNAARYIRDELSHKVPGGLSWERWLRTPGKMVAARLLLDPTLMTFPAVSLAALAWSAALTVLDPPAETVVSIAMALSWLVGLTLTVTEIAILSRTRRAYWRYFWTRQSPPLPSAD